MTIKALVTAGLLAVTVLGSLSCASNRTSEGTGEYIDDTVITAKVKAAFLAEAGLNVAEINVETFKGVVQLSGFIQSRTDANRAIVLTRSIAGVMSVQDDMQIK
ncbi:BON domain-containing protein [Rheinheimera sediminis]|uniref:BON domain-containing protein n=1 Tax=Rheinheimera sp. YQF-1 TaxID=2499626 RepID=UPI000FDBDCF3|nr:BON domain-containing protein [Rheinheimera sp. YQF-1]RVT44871.1 BON domain-containing protein [Rheinheimera sp. YQF-1]